MGRELQQRWGLSAGVTVFYDRPPDFFRPATLQVCLPQGKPTMVDWCSPGLYTACGKASAKPAMLVLVFPLSCL